MTTTHEPLTKERTEYWLGFVEGYVLGRTRDADPSKGDPNPEKERVHEGEHWKQGRKDGYTAGKCAREKGEPLFKHSLCVVLVDKPDDWDYSARRRR